MAHFVGNTGTRMQFRCVDRYGNPIDISAATNAGDRQITMARPSGGSVVKVDGDAPFVTDGTDGWIEFITIASDFNGPGSVAGGDPFRAQVRIILPGGTWYSEIIEWDVLAVLT